MGLSALGTAATSGLLYKPQMIDEGDCGAIGGMKETEVLGENLPQRHFVHNKSHMTRPGLEPRAAAVGSQRLTAWAMARPEWLVTVGSWFDDRISMMSLLYLQLIITAYTLNSLITNLSLHFFWISGWFLVFYYSAQFSTTIPSLWKIPLLSWLRENRLENTHYISLSVVICISVATVIHVFIPK
jgi:hypothetical protein